MTKIVKIYFGHYQKLKIIALPAVYWQDINLGYNEKNRYCKE